MTKALVKITNRNELYKFLKNIDYKKYKATSMSDVYFLIRYIEDGKTYVEPTYFQEYKGSYFESPCTLMEYKYTSLRQWLNFIYGDSDISMEKRNSKVSEFDKDSVEYERQFQIGNTHYTIENFQCAPYLPKKLDILKILSEKDCLNYLLKDNKTKGKSKKYEF